MRKKCILFGMNGKYNRLLFLLFLLFTVNFIGYAQGLGGVLTPDSKGVLYVDKSISTSGDGSSWNSAAKELADAMLFAQTDGKALVSEIWVKEGTYYPMHKVISNDPVENPTTDRDQAFVLPKNVKLYGGFSSNATSIEERDLTQHKSTLSGDIGTSGDNTDNCYHVIIAAGDIGSVVLDGFIIQDGKADGKTQMVVNGEYIPQNTGGGIADVYYTSVAVATSHAVRYSNVEIAFNNAAISGGGVYAFGETNSLFNKTVIKDNSSLSGAGVHCYANSSITWTNSLIAGNQAETYGGGILMESGSKGTLINVTITKNTAGSYGTGIRLEGGSIPFIKNTIVWGNLGAGSGNIEGGSPNCFYSLIQDDDPAFHDNWFDCLDGKNTANDPLFNPDFTLAASSPLINKGDNTLYNETIYGNLDLALRNRIEGSSIDLGAFETQSAVAISAQFTAQNTTICFGDNVSLTIPITNGTAPYTLEYKANGVTNIVPNITTNSYTLTVTPSTTTTFTLVSIKDAAAKENLSLSGTVTLTVTNKPTIGQIASPAATCLGGLLSVSTPVVSLNGSTIIQEGWTLEGTPFNPATDVVGLSDNGKKLRYWVTNACGTTNSNEVRIAVSNEGLQVQNIGVGCSTVVDLNQAIVSAAQGTTVAFYLNESDTQLIPNPTTVVISNTQSTTFYAIATGGNSSCVTPEKVSFKVTPSQATQRITFDVISPKLLGTPDFDLMATASSGLVITYTSSNPKVATIVNGKIHIVGVGVTIITASQSGNECFLPAEDVSRELNVIELGTVEDLTPEVVIEGQPWPDLSQSYIICESNITSVRIQLTVTPGATVDKGLSFTIQVLKPGIKKVQFTVTSKDGKRAQTYEIYIDKRVSFESIVKMRWNNSFAVINNPANNGGYAQFVAYKWFRNEEVVGTNQYYSVNNLAWEKLNPEDLYYAEVETEEGESIRTCYWNGILDNFSVSAYPNPAQKGGVVYVEASINEMAFANARVELYTLTGTFISQTKVTGRITGVPMNENPGVYVLKLIGENDYERSFKVIIKE